MTTINTVRQIVRVLAGQEYTATDGMGCWRAVATEDGYFLRLADSVAFVTDRELETCSGIDVTSLEQLCAAVDAAKSARTAHEEMRRRWESYQPTIRRRVCSCGPPLPERREVSRARYDPKLVPIFVCMGCLGIAQNFEAES